MSSETVSFGLATIRNDDNNLEAAIVIGQWVYPLASLDESFHDRTVFGLLQDWPSVYSSLQQLASRVVKRDGQVGSHRVQLKDAKLDTPIRYPNKLLAVGANYSGHLREMGLPAEKWDPMPFFSCPPTSSIVGPGKTVPLPPTTKQFDWECELTVVMGKGLRNASQEQAAETIAGYTIGLDLSCRDLFRSHGHRWLVKGDFIKAQIGDMEPLEVEIY